MKNNLLILLLFCLSISAKAIEISHIEPPFWWTGMKNSELQIMVYGEDIRYLDVWLEYPDVKLKQILRPDNPNYLFIYLEIGENAQPGIMKLTFSGERKNRIVKEYELKARSTDKGAQGFSPSDVMYLIMPDRFANGDPSNDVWDDEDVNRNEPFARHGGDLAGINAHLDYLNNLGITTIWLNPVLENKMNGPEKYKSYHGYAITDFYKVDKRLGTNEEYRQLIENIHGRGMKIVMDMIYNHCGSQHRWMNNLPYSDWLNHQEGFVPTTHNLLTVMDVHAPQSEVEAMTDGWFVPSMPDLNQRNKYLADYLIQNSIWWIEYARIDGIRHDTHPYADFHFLAEWNRRLLDEYPDFNIVGESWYAAGAPLAWWQRNSKLNKGQTNLKTVMDFNLMTACNEAFAVESSERNPLKRIYEVIAQDFMYEDLNNILVFLDNHDTSRFLKQEETDLDRYKQAIAFLLTTRGIPQLYYGTEILMTGEKKDGDGNLRKDFPGGWQGDAVNAFTAEGRTDLQNEAHDYLQKLLQFRKTNSAVAEGSLIHYAPDHQTECYVYARVNDNNGVLVIINGSNKEQTLPLEKYHEVIYMGCVGKDVISGESINLHQSVTVSAKGVMVIEMIVEEVF
ncbi:MAG: glycoside hydrolase family 13 protein [Cytophagaceae bacterium]|jgi:glycosidase|nr:glycoside hydrolase family 13 protein [Cytophagaceae bacterium]